MQYIDNKSDKIGIYAGTFDPFTSGHLSIVKRATTIFDKVIVAVAKETGKQTLFTLDERVELARESIFYSPQYSENTVEVVAFDGLLVDFAKSCNVQTLIRGLRAVSDFEYELQGALINRKLSPDIETVFLMAGLQWLYISSTVVRNLAELGGDLGDMVSEPVQQALLKKYNIKK